MMPATNAYGPLLRLWRKRRGLSQLALSLDAGISARHLSFLENGRAQPSRMMASHLAEALEIPLRQRNDFLLAAGFAPMHGEHDLEAEALVPVHDAIGHLLAGHEPYPALAVDGGWNLVAANEALNRLVADVSPVLLEPPVNVLRLSLHPEGLAPAILNLGAWRSHLMARLRRQASRTQDDALMVLLAELAALPGPADEEIAEEAVAVVPLRLRTAWGTLALLSTTTVFGTALDITAASLAIESFFPADAATAEALRLAASSPTQTRQAAGR